MNKTKKIYTNLFVIIFYFIYKIIPLLIIGLLGIKLNSLTSKSIYLMITSIICLLFIIYIYKIELMKEIKEFKIKNSIKYIPIYLIGILLMFVSNYFISKITNANISENENYVRQYIKMIPIFMTFSAVIYSPIIEELTFRKAFMNILGKNYFFVLLSGITFGLIHISSGSLNDYLMIIPYIIIGIDFSYIYYKSNNIFTTITLHSFHNLILLILQFIGG